MLHVNHFTPSAVLIKVRGLWALSWSRTTNMTCIFDVTKLLLEGYPCCMVVVSPSCPSLCPLSISKFQFVLMWHTNFHPKDWFFHSLNFCFDSSCFNSHFCEITFIFLIYLRKLYSVILWGILHTPNYIFFSTPLLNDIIFDFLNNIRFIVNNF